MSHREDEVEHIARFTLYENRRGFWVVGRTESRSRFKVLQILPEPGAGDLRFTIEEFSHVFSQSEIEAWLSQQKAAARRDEDDFRQKAPAAWGLLGIIRFTGCFYLCMVTRCSVVALLGHHQVYHIDETKLVPLVHSSRYEVPDRRSAEARLASTFHSLDLAKTFYFSPTYDLTNTLQTNMSGKIPQSAAMFVWNSHLLSPISDTSEAAARMAPATRKAWFLKIIHGFIDQARVSVFGNSVYITLIARRSHQFAGARFYKRGVNIQGYPANEVETEQIVSNQLHSQFSDRFTSYVQHRGSICVSWSQMSNNMSPQPPIRIDAVDPYYEAAAKHFDRMFSRYGYPVRVLNLVKTREKRARESLLSLEFEACIRYLNQFLPQRRSDITTDVQTRMKGLSPISVQAQQTKSHKGGSASASITTTTTTSTTNKAGHGLELEGGVIEYTHWDMSRAAKSRSTEVMDYLGKYAKRTMEATFIFQAGVSIQRGVCRTNCIDCLDRTNAAQSVIAKYALGYQLHALGIIDKPKVDYDTDVMDLLTEMYHDHGDTLALQYGGSNLVNTVETYRRINQWTSHSRDLIESIRRFYSNSFMDAQRQDAINVFLGNYQYTEGTNLWDLSTDYYLHNSAPDLFKRSYRQWYEPRHLLINESDQLAHSFRKAPRALVDDWHTYTPLAQLFMSKINSTDKYSKQASPFETHAATKKRAKPSKTGARNQPSEHHAKQLGRTAIDELELLYSQYLNSAGSSRLQDDFATPIGNEYQQYLDGPEEPQPTEYYIPEPEWSAKPLDSWASDIYAGYIRCS